MSRTITIVESGPRDGLQSESHVLPTADKVELINRMVAAGVGRIEVASFVHPRLVPQMADAEAVLAELGPSPAAVSYLGLVLNRRGLERALATTVDEIGFVVAAADGYNRANQRAVVAETIAEIEAMIPQARDAGRFAGVTISVAWGDPYDGEVPTSAVVELAQRAEAAGADEVALGDTIGVAVPATVTAVLGAVREASPDLALRCHFHNTRQTGLANVVAALECGVTVFDTSVGGIGGSPFAPDAGGNVATEDLLFLAGRSSLETGVDLAATVRTARWLGGKLGHALPGSGHRLDPWP
jgi:hydroxymethylglutaryl-CoA lyase